MANVNIDDAAMNAAMSVAILNSLTEQARASLISNAIKSLMEVEASGSGYSGDRRTRIQKAFDFAVDQAAQKLAVEVITGDKEIQEQIKTVMVQAAKLALADTDKLADVMAGSIRKAISGDRY